MININGKLRAVRVSRVSQCELLRIRQTPSLMETYMPSTNPGSVLKHNAPKPFTFALIVFIWEDNPVKVSPIHTII